MAQRFTNAQKRAYYSGMGYAAAKAGKRIPFKSEANKQSFKNGYKTGTKKVEGYPSVNGGKK